MIPSLLPWWGWAIGAYIAEFLRGFLQNFSDRFLGDFEILRRKKRLALAASSLEDIIESQVEENRTGGKLLLVSAAVSLLKIAAVIMALVGATLLVKIVWAWR